jgi:hypothetical protein
MAALDRHHAGAGMSDIQARISLQTRFAMVLDAAGDTGVTSDTTSGISDNEVVHGALFSPSLERLQPHPQAGHTERTLPISFTSSQRRRHLDNQAKHKSHKKLHKQADVLLSYDTTHDLNSWACLGCGLKETGTN